MIQYINPQNGQNENSPMIKVFAETSGGFNLYPVPFDEELYIDFEPGVTAEKILLTDLTGRNIRTQFVLSENGATAKLMVADTLQPGLYIIHIQTNKSVFARTIFKR
jgi:hypothetical protein